MVGFSKKNFKKLKARNETPYNPTTTIATNQSATNQQNKKIHTTITTTTNQSLKTTTIHTKV